MAYDRNDDKKPSFPLGRFNGEGNMVEDPKEIGKGDSPFVAFKVAFNSRNFKEYEGSFFVGVTVSGGMAERVLDDGAKGKRVILGGLLYADEPWEDKNGDMIPSFSLKADEIGMSWRFPERSNEGGSSRRRKSNDDDDDRSIGRRGRGRSRDEDEGEDDEPKGGRSSRSRHKSDDDEDEPRGGRSSRSRRSSSDDDDEPRGGSRRRSRGRVEDNGDDIDD